ncbi:bifunctional aspartate kinase/homoserine dehydrogenase I [Gynurincola endophyticus]|uniref:bifunctional aspartate kinase/homoserine dehydrogenase I n=1 Tax=Gynurincola endophyticus TaxID=2479004 RepID=UPI000F8E7752|nr:bifunctional aspartate kinase/homoserine dehydrogenase I [Gynurincola endophyticus]
MQVLKFGGTSVANAENINKVVAIVKNAVQQDRTIVVVSAFGGVTDQLLLAGSLAASGNEEYKEVLSKIEDRHLTAVKELVPVAQQSSVLSWVKQRCNEIEDICNGVFLLGELSPRTKDKMVSFGELVSSNIIAHRFNLVSVPAQWKDSRELIKTDNQYGSALVNVEKTNQLIQQYFTEASQNLFILPGFIASNEEGITTTLGRGGSDFTAAIFAAALNADNLEIWTDVSGMMTADPRLVPHAKILSHISYQEAMELSHFGAKVIYPPTIQPVMQKNIPTWIKNTFAPEDRGTVIQSNVEHKNGHIRGITSINNIALLSLEGSGMVGIPGFSKRLFETLANAQINVILITQGSSEHSICVGVEVGKTEQAKLILDQTFKHEIDRGQVQPITVETQLSVVALVGDQMKSQPGVSGKMFGALGRNGVNVRAIAQGSSERNISAVITTADVKKAINVLHEEFFETSYKQIHLFIAGTGNVGGKLIDQLYQQKDYLKHHLKLIIKVIGVANSKKMLFDDQGIDLANWKSLLVNGTDSSLDDFVENIKLKNLRNSIFVDVTANEAVAKVYATLLEKSVAVVACNKIAAAAEYNYYKELKDLARVHNTFYLFETNVGAALPIIGTLNDLLRSGDQINRIEAVLSGTLNFVFNNYDGSVSFASVVQQAQQEGYTEPDPRLDLSGVDVMRKIMILTREAGYVIEMNEVDNTAFLPASCMNGSVEDFYLEMEKQESHFKNIYDQAAANGMKLKFVARFEDGKASVGLQHIDPAHNLYHLYGKDNIVLFYTQRYVDQPLVVKGAGAGAEVTASGVFADIVRAAR